MKLILANNQTETFVDFYKALQKRSHEAFEYSGYSSLLFSFDAQSEQPVVVRNIVTGRELKDYSGVYINGYLETYELAAATALCCQALDIPFVNKELANAPSLSKLTAYAKLAAAHVPIPKTLAATKQALLKTLSEFTKDLYPAVLKRADAERGVDNFKVKNPDEVADLLKDYDELSLWILQAYIPNDGFYLVSFYNQKPAFSIYRQLQERSDGALHKAHIFKPKGGRNASLVDLKEVPHNVMEACQAAVIAMNRQIASVDCLLDNRTKSAAVLEVNYNPQLVTIETFKEIRIQTFLDNLTQPW